MSISQMFSVILKVENERIPNPRCNMASHFYPAQLNHSRRDFVKGAAALMVSPLLGCGSGSAESSNKNAELKTLLNNAWESRYAGKRGGLTLHMIAPNGEFFASSIPDVGADSHFRGASITKTFTAAGIMLLVQEQRLSLDTALSDVLPDAKIPFNDIIKIGHLLNHTAGVFDLVNNVVPKNDPQFPLADKYNYAGMSYLEWVSNQDANHSFTKDELIRVLVDTQLYKTIPNKEFHYSDQHFTILGKVVEVVSGMSLNEYVTYNFLGPSGMGSTHFETDGSRWNLPIPLIKGYTIGRGDSTEHETTDYNYSYDPGSGNLISTSTDLVRWMRSLVKGQTRVSAETIKLMTTISAPSAYYGLGMAHMKTLGNVSLGWGHTGGTEGYLTDAYHDPIADVTYVLQCALYDSDQTISQAIWMADTALEARSVIGY